jgi:sucrose phosphorylase
VRGAHAAFHPHGNQQVLDLNPNIFGMWRSSPGDEDFVLCLHNVSGHPQELDFNSIQMLNRLSDQPSEIISGKLIQVDQPSSIQPYQTLWIK